MIPTQIQDWCKDNGFGKITSIQQVAGGCINQGARIFTTSGETFFIKTNPKAPQKMFARETEGLRALQTQDGPAVPKVHTFDKDFILMEDLAPAPACRDYWPSFGRRLATLHLLHTSPKFGFEHDNYIGSTPQPNSWNEDGYIFFRQNRLMYQVDLAREGGFLNADDYKRLEFIARRLTDLIPDQSPSLIHGDLWSGNVITDRKGQPALIDPAVHYGWAEAELGMTALFGGFPEAFYNAYQEIRPLITGWQGRLPIYNLYHLLNHINLFGGGYLAQVRAILQKYS